MSSAVLYLVALICFIGGVYYLRPKNKSNYFDVTGKFVDQSRLAPTDLEIGLGIFLVYCSGVTTQVACFL